jgi:hypothetical protein
MCTCRRPRYTWIAFTLRSADFAVGPPLARRDGMKKFHGPKLDLATPKLVLRKEIVKQLAPNDLERIVGGVMHPDRRSTSACP